MEVLAPDYLVSNKKQILDKKMVLIISPFLPYPPKDGGKLKMYNSIRFLSRDYDVILLSFIEDEIEKKYIPHLRFFCKEVFTVIRRPSQVSKEENKPLPEVVKAFYSNQFRIKLQEILKTYPVDVVQTEYTFMAHYTMDINNIPKILVEHDTSLFSLFGSYEKPVECGYFRWIDNWLRKVRFHKEAYSKFDKVIVFTDKEGKRVMNLSKETNTSVMPIELDMSAYNFDTTEKAIDIIFIGYMGHYPNIDGIFYFCNKIFPLIQNKIPETSLSILGTDTGDRLSALADRKNINVIGEVADIKPFLAKSRVFVVPLRLGGGLKVKILEAMAMGLAVVATPCAVSGIGLENNKEVIIGSNPRRFAEGVINLLKDQILCYEMGDNARLFVRRNYDSNIVSKQYKSVYNF